MGKKSKKRAPKRDKPKVTENKPNPFEIRFNKQRHSILGRQSKKERGLPGISRGKAISKREKTLLKEYKDFNKVNNFVDRRIGENDATADPEERALVRFAKEWRKNKKSALFNLNDEDLTHMGKSLSEIDDFNDRKSSSEDENENLSSDFIKKAHFGGFMTLKSANKVEPEKSHKEMMQELIQETKKQKYERQSQREANDNLTEKLDEDFKLLQNFVSKSKQSVPPEASKTDDPYDVAVKSLRFEIKGKPTDRLKTEKEIDSEAKEKLSRMEAERKIRMTGKVEMSKTKVPHISADSLDDGFALDDPEGHSDEEGKDNNEMSEESNKQKDDSALEAGNNGSETCSDNEEEDDNEGNTDAGSEKNEEDNDAGSDKNEEDNDAGTDSESENLYTGMFSDDSESGNESVDDDCNNKMHILSQKEIKHKGKEIPSSLDDLLILLGDNSTSQKISILENIIKSNHSTFGASNKKMTTLFEVLLQYLCVLCTKANFDSAMIDALVPIMYSVLQYSPSEITRSLLDMLSLKRELFLKSCKQKDGRKIPCLGTLILFKLVSIFYPTSDFHHAVVTASEVFMSEILVISQITSLQDIVKGLFVCNLLLEYVSYAKRFAPEAVAFLQTILSKGRLKIISKTLAIPEDDKSPRQMPLNWLVEGMEVQSCFSTGLQLLKSCLNILKEFAELYLELPSFEEMFGGLKPKLEALLSQECFSGLKEDVQDLHVVLCKAPPKTLPLVQSQKKMKCLKLYEPRLQADFTGKKQRPVMSAKKAERQKLLYKYKKEFKGAMREIRRDNQYISRVQLNEQMERDSERKEKLKRLYQDLAQQEGEFKRYKKRRR